jgi:hypothetical protein
MRHLQKAARSSTQSDLSARGTPQVSDADMVRHPSSSLTVLQSRSGSERPISTSQNVNALVIP